jgi:uncharacterized protein
MTSSHNNAIKQTAEFVRQRQSGEGSGHDWWHTYRVWKTATTIAALEKADLFVVELAALLHDVADWKFHQGNLSAGAHISREFLQQYSVDISTIDHVCEIISTLSFKGAGVATPMRTIEGKVVQDADRLDAIGAIGIARAFAYGGFKQQEMHNPEIPPALHATFEQYKNNKGTTINHFYEKLLLLKNLMNTATGRKMAQERHTFMETYLQVFFHEVGQTAPVLPLRTKEFETTL